MEAYHKLPYVEAVHLIYVTLADAAYDQLYNIATHTEEVTKALDHVLKDFNTDCGSCTFKAICDEVEGMRELHFGHKDSK